MSEYITDPELLKQLNASNTDSEYVTDPELLKQLGEPTTSSRNQPIAPAFYPGGPTRLAELGKTVGTAAAGPFVDVAKNTYKGYIDKPVKFGIDALYTFVAGTPVNPIMEGFKTGKDTVQAFKKASGDVTDWLSIFAMEGNPEKKAAANIIEGMPDLEKKRLEKFIETNGFKNLKDYKLPAQYQEQFGNAIQTLAKSIPTGTEKGVALAKPFLKGAGKVLGPAGMALDLYSAGEMTRDTKLGERLRAGEGTKAMKAFKQMNVPYGLSNYTPEEIEYLKANASERDLKALGIK